MDGGDQHFRFSAIERKHLRSVKLDARALVLVLLCVVPGGLIPVAYKNIWESAKYSFILHFQVGERRQISLVF